MKLADIFSVHLGDVDEALPLSAIGVDSLVAVELRNWVGTMLKSKVTIFEILQSSSVTQFSELVAGRTRFNSWGVEQGEIS